MQIDSFNSLETQVLSKFNEGNKTHEALKSVVSFNEKTLTQVLENLISRNVLSLNTKTNEYEYTTPIKGEKLILDGNILLPTTIIKLSDKLLISRGKWYEFPLDFDIRRIIWNVQLPNAKRSTLCDLIQESVLKEKKSKIVQLDEYKALVGKIIPYNKNIGLHINVVGETVTDIYIIFRVYLYPSAKDKTIFTEFRGFKVHSFIKTEELINELRKKPEERNFENIQLEKLFNLSNFIFAGNEIPYFYDEESVSYAKICVVNKRTELDTKMVDGNKKISNIERFDFQDNAEAAIKLSELFKMYASQILEDNDFWVEMTN